MSHRFKVLVDFNGCEKYSVIIDSNYKVIVFNTVFTEIQRQLKLNVSLETHVFELYDLDFKEYCVITSAEEVVDNLSRIRIRPKSDHSLDNCLKSVSNLTIDSDNECLNNSTLNKTDDKSFEFNILRNNLLLKEDLECSDNDIQNNLDINKADKIQSLFSDAINNMRNENIDTYSGHQNNHDIQKMGNNTQNSLTDKDPDISGEDNPVVRIIPDIQDCFTNAINYLGIELNHSFAQNQSSRYMAYKTVVLNISGKSVIALQLKDQDIKDINNLLNFMTLIRHIYAINQENGWSFMSNLMINSFGHKEWSVKWCKNYFNNALDLYKKSLNCCPNLETAVKVYPLFTPFHKLDLSSMLSTGELNELQDLRLYFANKSSPKKQKSIFGSTLSLASTVSTSSYANRTSDSRSQASHHSDRHVNKNRSSSASNYMNERDKRVKECLISKLSVISNKDIGEIKYLLNSIKSTTKQFGGIDKNRNLWPMVSTQMTLHGYHHYNESVCRNKFNGYVTDIYAMTLKYFPDYKSAVAVNPLFDFIHTMDLSSILYSHSLQKIQELRESFKNN